MKEMGKKELLMWLDDRRKEYESRLYSLYPGHMHKHLLKTYDETDNLIRKLIEDSKSYDERVDKIVDYYRRQDSIHKVTKLGLTCPDCGKKVAIDMESGQEEWLNSKPKVVDEALIKKLEEWVHFYLETSMFDGASNIRHHKQWISDQKDALVRIKQLLSQKPHVEVDEELAKAREYFNQVLTQNVNPKQFNMKYIQTIDEAIKQLLSQKRVVTREVLVLWSVKLAASLIDAEGLYPNVLEIEIGKMLKELGMKMVE